MHSRETANGLELSGAAELLHPILALRLRPLQRVVSRHFALDKTGAYSWPFAAGATGSFTNRPQWPAFQQNRII